jgi:lysozyme
MIEMDNVIDQIKRHEGLRLKVYKCSAGKLTIGYGRNLEDRGLTEDEAKILLVNDVLAVVEGIRADRQKRLIFDVVNPARQAVLIDMGFNLGVDGLFRFGKMWGALTRFDFDRAAAEMLESKWAQQVNRRAVELAAQMRTGLWAQQYQEL